MKEPLCVAVTGGAGQIAYSLLPRIISGEAFGRDQPISLRLLDLPDGITYLEAVRCELIDCASPLLCECIVSIDPKEVFQGVHWAILIGAKPRGPGMERKDLLRVNAGIFADQGECLDRVADKGVRVLVIGNPCNTNAWITQQVAPSLRKENIMAMTRLDENRARAHLAEKAGVPIAEVSSVPIWGNHSTTQVPDFYHAKIGGKPVVEVIRDEGWLHSTFLSFVRKRGAEVIHMRGKSSAASAAHAIVDTIQSLLDPRGKDHRFSLAVSMAGNAYGIDEDLVCSVLCCGREEGGYAIVNGFDWPPFLAKEIEKSIVELQEEREAVRNFLEG